MSEPVVRGRARRDERERAVARLRVAQGGVASRRQLHDRGIDRFAIRNEVRAGRWDTRGRNTVVFGPVSQIGEFWSAIFESGPSSALDGAAALKACGLIGFEPQRIDVSLARGARRQVTPGVAVHVPRNRGPLITTPGGLPAVAPPLATVNAAHWAVSRRQAALLLVMPVQQRIVTGDELARAWAANRRGRRGWFLDDIVLDIADGAQALSELDFSADCRRRHLPAPTRQSIRRLPGRVAFLDAEFAPYGFAVEIDGSHHFEVTQSADTCFVRTRSSSLERPCCASQYWAITCIGSGS